MRGQALVDEWCAWMGAGDLATGTVALRRSQLLRLADRVPLTTATEADIVAWLDNPRWSTETRRSNRSGIRAFYTWAQLHGRVDASPAAGLRRIRPADHMPRPIPERELTTALLHADREQTVMLLLGAYAGLRRSEIAAFHSLEVAGDELVVLGKGRRRRRIPIHPRVEPHIRRLDGWAFPSPRLPGRPVGPTYVRDRLAEVLPEPWTPHSLRHRFATVTYRACRDITVVQRLLGHAKPETTLRYVLLEQDDLRAAVRAVA